MGLAKTEIKPAYLYCLIRVFAVHMKKYWALCCPQSTPTETDQTVPLMRRLICVFAGYTHHRFLMLWLSDGRSSKNVVAIEISSCLLPLHHDMTNLMAERCILTKHLHTYNLLNVNANIILGE